MNRESLFAPNGFGYVHSDREDIKMIPAMAARGWKHRFGAIDVKCGRISPTRFEPEGTISFYRRNSYCWWWGTHWRVAEIVAKKFRFHRSYPSLEAVMMAEQQHLMYQGMFQEAQSYLKETMEALWELADTDQMASVAIEMLMESNTAERQQQMLIAYLRTQCRILSPLSPIGRFKKQPDTE